MALPSARPTSFLDLPPELRNHVYELSGCLEIVRCNSPMHKTTQDARCGALITQDRIGADDHICHRTFIGGYGQDKTTKIHLPEDLDKQFARFNGQEKTLRRASPYQVGGQPPLTRVSRQVREETLPMLWDSATFVLTNFSGNFLDGLQCFTMMGPTNVAFIRKVEILVCPVISNGSELYGMNDRELERQVKQHLERYGVDVDSGLNLIIYR